MTNFKIILIILVICTVAASAFADIYEWTDEDGVKHYSNFAPPADSTVLMKTKEEPYDEAADRARVAAEQQQLLELARQQIAQRENELELREAEAERRLAEADRVAQEALREADDYLEAAGSGSRVIYGGSGYWCSDYRYDCSYPIYNRWYYRKNPGHRYYNKLYYSSPYQRYFYVKKHYGPNRTDDGHKYRGKSRDRQNAHYSTRKFNFRGSTNLGGRPIGSHGGRFNGWGNTSLRSPGFGRRQ
jgi:hypothetical protein